MATESPKAFIEAVEHKTRREDAKVLLKLFKKVTGLKPRMCKPNIVAFGRYCYKYESGHEGESFMTGFSPRKTNLVLYIMPGYHDLSEMLSRLGKHKLGKSCLYINKLADVDLDVVEEIVRFGVDYMREKYTVYEK